MKDLCDWINSSTIIMMEPNLQWKRHNDMSFKLNRTRSVTSLQPDTRNGHKPSVVTTFWGDKSNGNRGTTRGPGKKIEVEDYTKRLHWFEELHPVDPVTLKEVKPRIKFVLPSKPRKTLDDLLAKFNSRRTR